MFCMNCGKELVDNAAFCPHCGSAQNGQAAQSAQRHANGGKAGVSQAVGNMVGSVVEEVSGRFDRVYGETEHVDLDFRDFFSEVLKKHEHGESEGIFISGTEQTTPDIRAVAKTWRKPWFYSRVLLLMLIAFGGCYLLFSVFTNPIALPSIMVFGSFAVPVACFVFFFEANAEQNISFLDVLRFFIIGGVMSILMVMILVQLIPGSGVGALVPAVLTGLVEELAKALIVAYLIIKRGRPVSILNGLLIGATVGAGFAAFESAGYAFNSFFIDIDASVVQDYIQQFGVSIDTIDGYRNLLFSFGFSVMMHTIILRGLLAVGGHVAWAAIEGAGMSLACGGKDLTWNDLFKKEFLLLLAISVACHGYWDWTPLADAVPVPYLELVLLTVAVWIFILVLMRRGLAEVNQKAREAERAEVGQNQMSR